jgi:hypothetical protein
VEFARQKDAGVLPNLRVLRLVEVCDLSLYYSTTRQGDHPPAETHRYELPSIVADAFFKAGIVLDIQLFKAPPRLSLA